MRTTLLLHTIALLAMPSLLTGCGSSSGDVVPAEQVATDTPDTIASEPTPAVVAPRDRAPAQIRGIYVNAYAAGSRTRLPRLLALADSTELNAFVIDVKDERGIRYRSEIALAMELAQESEVVIRDLTAMVDTMKAHGIWTIARIVVFKDPILSKARTDWSVRTPTGGLWLDRAGNSWVSPWDDRVWDYNIQIAEEVARAGFDEIQFDYVRFAEQFRNLPAQVHPRAEGDRTDAIAAFMNEARRRLHPLGVTVTADVFGLSPNTFDDVGIGQQWETISSVSDHILPMMYPSHYFATHLPNVPTPDLMPYETIFKSAGIARIRNDRMREPGVQPARVIVWLQAFSATWLRNHQAYGPQQLRDQKRGMYEVGFEDWILWHPGSRYEHVAAGLERE
ncbi:MAG: putative glycoside hydrolase, partial [Gemmatimonadetes bacterium]|nr:putative glycoside hydrolase [Gemmatimonadota bacterium]